MMDFIGSVWGMILWSAVCVVAGTVVGKPAWEWVRKFFPWNK